MKLGAKCHVTVHEYLASNGWPQYKPPGCPQELSSDARTAVATLLGKTVTAPDAISGEPPEFDPSYIFDAGLGSSLARDVVSTHEIGLVGVATRVPNWSEKSDIARVVPFPPIEVSLLHAPNQSTPTDIDSHVSQRIGGRRITILGGLRKPEVEAELRRRFGDNLDIRWIESEPKKEPSLDCLRMMSGDRDLLVCILGAPGQLGLGHSVCGNAVTIAGRGGVRVLKCERPSKVSAVIVESLFRAP
ncbi:MAG: hypothetical protein JHC98_10880 [Thermoleophilaceae bacterium]|nr:hypothetical protein [Thermoleophilaceae bacterium]